MFDVLKQSNILVNQKLTIFGLIGDVHLICNYKTVNTHKYIP